MKLTKANEICRKLLTEVWNGDDHAQLLKITPSFFKIDDKCLGSSRRGPLVLLDLINVFKGAVPDLSFQVEAQTIEKRRLLTHWTAFGRHTGSGLNSRPSGGGVYLNGSLQATMSHDGKLAKLQGTWDIATFLRLVGASCNAFEKELNLDSNEVRLRTTMEMPGIPILLFPTMSLPGWITWKRLIEILSKKQPVITSQLLANRLAFEGDSVPTSYSLRAETYAMCRALEMAKARGPFHIVGHSAGGAIALDYALENERHVKSLTLIEPTAPWVLKESNAISSELQSYICERMGSYSCRPTDVTYAEFLKDTMRLKGYEPMSNSNWPLLQVYKSNMRFRPSLFAHSDSLCRVRFARFPVLLIRGSSPDRFHRAIVDILRATFPKVQAIELPGGHAPHYREGLDAFVGSLSAFHHSISD